MMENISSSSSNFNEYNFIEKSFIYGGSVVGALTPIIATKYALSISLPYNNIYEEIGSWTGSVLLNLLPGISESLYPVPFYTSLFGSVAGTVLADMSYSLRNNKNNSLDEKLK